MIVDPQIIEYLLTPDKICYLFRILSLAISGSVPGERAKGGEKGEVCTWLRSIDRQHTTNQRFRPFRPHRPVRQHNIKLPAQQFIYGI